MNHKRTPWTDGGTCGGDAVGRWRQGTDIDCDQHRVYRVIAVVSPCSTMGTLGAAPYSGSSNLWDSYRTDEKTYRERGWLQIRCHIGCRQNRYRLKVQDSNLILCLQSIFVGGAPPWPSSASSRRFPNPLAESFILEHRRRHCCF